MVSESNVCVCSMCGCAMAPGKTWRSRRAEKSFGNLLIAEWKWLLTRKIRSAHERTAAVEYSKRRTFERAEKRANWTEPQQLCSTYIYQFICYGNVVRSFCVIFHVIIIKINERPSKWCNESFMSFPIQCAQGTLTLLAHQILTKYSEVYSASLCSERVYLPFMANIFGFAHEYSMLLKTICVHRWVKFISEPRGLPIALCAAVIVDLQLHSSLIEVVDFSLFIFASATSRHESTI